MTFLGIDLSSAALRAVLTDEDEALLAQAIIPLVTSFPVAGAAEQSPREWWTGTLLAIAAIRAAAPRAFAAMRGIGLAGQMHATVLLDERGKLIRPAMVWSDARGDSACRILERRLPALAATAGAAALPMFTAAKLVWLAEHEAENFAAIAHVLSAKDYLRFRLTGEYATDTSDAAGTLLLDGASRTWSEPAVAAVGIEPTALPTILEGAAWSGLVRPRLLAQWGIGHEVVVAGGGGDLAAAAIGTGAVRPGDALILLDGVAQVAQARDGHRAAATGSAVLAHALPGRWVDATLPVNGTLCLDWLAATFGEREIGRLVARAQDEFAGPADILFKPYGVAELHSLRADPNPRGVFQDLAAERRLAQLTQAVIEGICFSLKQAQSWPGSPGSGPATVAGEGAASTLFLLILASVLNRPLQRPANADFGAAMGAARLARIAATGVEPEDILAPRGPVEAITPVPDLAAAYAERWDQFRAFAAANGGLSEPHAAMQGRLQPATG